MAEWVQARTDLDTDPVVIRQAAALSIPALSVAFLWIKFWGWAREHTVTGRIESVTHEVVDAAIGVRGFAQSAGHWLLFDEAGLTIPKWEKHNDNGARKRFLANKRQVNKRKKVSRSSHDSVTQRRDKSVTRREEKREEINTPSSPPVGDASKFEVFWKAYPAPRRVDKAYCQSKWRTRKLDSVADKIIAHVRAMSQTEDWQKDGHRFAPQTKTYLNQSRWETPVAADDDDPKPPPMTQQEKDEFVAFLRQEKARTQARGVLSG